MNATMQLNDQNTTGKVLDHLGLVMSTIEKLGIIDKIDERIPLASEKNPKTSLGQRVAAMILNGLGFVDNRLYMFPEFLDNKPVSRLLGEGVNAEYFNDDALGRCLDKIYEYGVTTLFSELAFKIGAEQGLLGQSAHFDTTTLSVYGEYDEASPLVSADKDKTTAAGNPCPDVTYGYSKAHRPDLKQVVLNLATTGASGFPLWMESHSGNASDQKELRAAAKRMQAFCRELQDTPSFMYVADSAMYDSCIKDGGDLKWLTRVPERAKWVKELLQHDDSSYAWQTLNKCYGYCAVETREGGVHQRLCIVASEQARRRELKTFDKNLVKQQAVHDKSLWHLSNKEFGCRADAEKSIKALAKTLRYHQLETEVETVSHYANKGRPKKGETPTKLSYKVTGKVVENTARITKARHQKGRFVLATNELDQTQLANENMLAEYKEQSKTESGFRFIKDNTFEVSSIFLKKPSRISALMMVMTLCLMVHNVAQHQLRMMLESVDLDSFDPAAKLGKKPTMTRVFKLFQGVHELTVSLGEHQQCLIINMSDLVKRIIRCFGDRAITIYALSG